MSEVKVAVLERGDKVVEFIYSDRGKRHKAMGEFSVALY